MYTIGLSNDDEDEGQINFNVTLNPKTTKTRNNKPKQWSHVTSFIIEIKTHTEFLDQNYKNFIFLFYKKMIVFCVFSVRRYKDKDDVFDLSK